MSIMDHIVTFESRSTVDTREALVSFNIQLMQSSGIPQYTTEADIDWIVRSLWTKTEKLPLVQPLALCYLMRDHTCVTYTTALVAF